MRRMPFGEWRDYVCRLVAWPVPAEGSIAAQALGDWWANGYGPHKAAGLLRDFLKGPVERGGTTP